LPSFWPGTISAGYDAWRRRKAFSSAFAESDPTAEVLAEIADAVGGAIEALESKPDDHRDLSQGQLRNPDGKAADTIVSTRRPCVRPSSDRKESSEILSGIVEISAIERI
jgi:hypothetical protein